MMMATPFQNYFSLLRLELAMLKTQKEVPMVEKLYDTLHLV